MSQIYSATDKGFTAVRTDGIVLTWGKTLSGGDRSSVATLLDGKKCIIIIVIIGHTFEAFRVLGRIEPAVSIIISQTANLGII